MGGVPLGGGLETAPGLVYRAGSFVDVGQPVARRLRIELGLETLIDLRTDAEVRRDGQPLALEAAGVERVHIPIADGGNPIRSNPHPQPSDYARGYLHTLSVSGEAIGAAIAAIAAAERPLALACTLGKDRTGLIATLLLLACGASPTTIGREHALSGRQLRRAVPRLGREMTRKRRGERAFRRRIEATSTAAELFVSSWLTERESFAAGWASLGLDAATAEAVRSRLVRRTPAPRALGC